MVDDDDDGQRKVRSGFDWVSANVLNLISKMGFSTRFSTACVLFFILFFFLFPSSFVHLRISLALRLSVCLPVYISFFSLTLSLYLSRMVFALPESLITILLPFWRSLFSSFFLFLLWWKELIFIYLLNVTHTQCSNFYSEQILGQTFNCIASQEILWG